MRRQASVINYESPIGLPIISGKPQLLIMTMRRQASDVNYVWIKL